MIVHHTGLPEFCPSNDLTTSAPCLKIEEKRCAAQFSKARSCFSTFRRRLARCSTSRKDCTAGNSNVCPAHDQAVPLTLERNDVEAKRPRRRSGGDAAVRLTGRHRIGGSQVTVRLTRLESGASEKELRVGMGQHRPELPFASPTRSPRRPRASSKGGAHRYADPAFTDPAQTRRLALGGRPGTQDPRGEQRCGRPRTSGPP